MIMKKKSVAGLGILLIFGLLACSPEEPQLVQPVNIPDNTIDPAVWGKAYPVEYDLWLQTEEPTPAGKSKYKVGFDADNITYDKLSMYPYMALLFNGWGFGIEYNEPRGHANMLKDQLEIDAKRVGAGGVCLTCKTPYAPELEENMGEDYYKLPFKEVVDRIPEEHRELGVACIDCHDNKDLTLQLSRNFTLGRALDAMGVQAEELNHQEMRSAVCAQCHVTYNITKTAEGKSDGIYFPWQTSTWGNISVENIIEKIRSDPNNKEWTQSVTGFKLAFMRHPEFELYSYQSTHWQAGASCSDCHMPYTKIGVQKVSDHRVMSPLKADLRACAQCHAEDTEWLKQRVIGIQDRTVSLMLRAGYATATAAKLFETLHNAQEEGTEFDPRFYAQAKDFYLEAFYRQLFIGAENSVGFHNPPEALRVLGDSVAFAGKSEALLRQMLAEADVQVPMDIDLELTKYVDERGENKLMGKPEQEIEDPFGLQKRFLQKR
ncbi:ammonia-forming cytochrome c nitrite reductase subunit c552 [Desulfopila inferna]|uniref:ammonia-forming cytochrome c nitrite reductase subunit c552 n=1 Tax=Desulfopila inferna TaxID=468528 RepID=UPI0019648B28|nr:ammonia-forming cytochrome c nitrite reductase subunit c552 [Desulfopila inferna]MBM9603741.1 ammonia-forming cytochrome c nitrite reductase subunit c552 [Desulfopila inferna]